jgi:hypothetical protein
MILFIPIFVLFLYFDPYLYTSICICGLFFELMAVRMWSCGILFIPILVLFLYFDPYLYTSICICGLFFELMAGIWLLVIDPGRMVPAL